MALWKALNETILTGAVAYSHIWLVCVETQLLKLHSSNKLKLGGEMLSSEDVENVLLDHDQCPTKDDQLKLYKSINMSRKFTSSEDFGEAIMNNLNSPICIGWLNKLSCSRRVVAFMMLEFYLHITLICSFLKASELHLTETNPNYAWARVMIPVSTGKRHSWLCRA